MAIQNLQIRISVEETVASLYGYLYPVQIWAGAFLTQTHEIDHLKDSRWAASEMLRQVSETLASLRSGDRKITQQEVSSFVWIKDQFEQGFDRDHRRLHVYIVTRKALFDNAALLESPEDAFPDHLRPLLPVQALEDFREAARCLAFELPTACAFHVCRGTEALILRYYETLANNSWTKSQRDWGRYDDELSKLGAPPAVVMRLEEIRKMDRNSYTHPEKNVTAEESPFLFTLCMNVSFQILQEIEKLTNGTP